MLKVFVILIFIYNALFASVATFSEVNGDVDVIRKVFNPITKILKDTKVEKQILKAYKGFEIEKYDVIKVSKDASAKIIFSDKTRVMLGKGSVLDIEEYQFDEKEGGDASLDFKSGMFNFITGKIGKIAPERFKIKTKTATIGIRGTEAGCVEKKNSSVCYCSYGGINTSTSMGNVDVPKGMKTTIKPKTPPKPAVKYIDLEGYAFGLLKEQIELRQQYAKHPHRIIWEIKQRH